MILNGCGGESLPAVRERLRRMLANDGHTDSQPYAPSASYGNWELSTDRANGAGRVLQSHGIPLHQITQVRGFADQRLRKPDAPLDPANRPISVIVQYVLKS